MLKDPLFNIEEYYAEGSQFFKALPQVQLALVLYRSLNATTSTTVSNKFEGNVDTALFSELLAYRYSQEISMLAMGKSGEAVRGFDISALKKLIDIFEVVEKFSSEEVRALYENAPHFVMLALKYYATKLLVAAQEKNRAGKNVFLPGSSERASDRSALLFYVADNIGKLGYSHEAFFLRDAYRTIRNLPQASMAQANRWLHDDIFTHGASAVKIHLFPALNVLSDNQLHVLFKGSAYTLENLRECAFPQFRSDDEVFACEDERVALQSAAQELGHEAFRGAACGYTELREDVKGIFDELGSVGELDSGALKEKVAIVFLAISERQQLQSLLNSLPNRDVLNRYPDFAKFFLQMLALNYLSIALLQQPVSRDDIAKAEFFYFLAENYEAMVENFSWDNECFEATSALGANAKNTLIQQACQKYSAIQQSKQDQQKVAQGENTSYNKWPMYFSSAESAVIDLTLDGVLLDHFPPLLVMRIFGGDDITKEVRDSIASMSVQRQSVADNVSSRVDRYRENVNKMLRLVAKDSGCFNENIFRCFKVLNDELKVLPEKPRLNKDKDFAKFFLTYRSLYYMNKAVKGGAGAQNATNKANFLKFLFDNYDEVVVFNQPGAGQDEPKAHFNQIDNSALVHQAYQQYQKAAGEAYTLDLTVWALELLQVPGAVLGASVDSKICADLQCLVGLYALFDFFGRDMLAKHMIETVGENSKLSQEGVAVNDQASGVSVATGWGAMYQQGSDGSSGGLAVKARLPTTG